LALLLLFLFELPPINEDRDEEPFEEEFPPSIRKIGMISVRFDFDSILYILYYIILFDSIQFDFPFLIFCLVLLRVFVSSFFSSLYLYVLPVSYFEVVAVVGIIADGVIVDADADADADADNMMMLLLWLWRLRFLLMMVLLRFFIRCFASD